MRWDLFAILMLVPWAATFLGSLTAVKVSLKTPRRQGGLLGFAAGVMVPHQHMDEDKPEGHASHISRPMLVVLAVALHNIPEGMALGVVIAAAMQDAGMSWTAALVFGLGLALQNFPEGMAVVLPLRQAGRSAKSCTWLGFLASLAEPAAALLALGMTSALMAAGSVVMPILLSMAAGAMKSAIK